MPRRSLPLPLALLALAACTGADDPAFDRTLTAPLLAVKTGAESFTAHPNGDDEVPARPTLARGNAYFQVSEDGSAISYKLIVANIENVVQSHIHIGPPGVNGPVTVFLYGLVASGGGRVDGVLAEGTFTAADLIGPLAGMTIADLLAEIKAGNAYVNVHTNDGDATPNEGPGDFPGGEIRAQVGGGHTNH